MSQAPVSVLHVHSGNLFGGVERVMETLVAYAPGRPLMTSAFALCFEGRLSRTLRDAGAVVHELGETHVRRPAEVLRARRRLHAVLEAGRYDVAMVHSSWSQAIFGSAIAGKGVPLVRWFHAPDAGPRWMEFLASRSTPAFALYNSRYTMAGASAGMNGVPGEIHFPLTRAVAAEDSQRVSTRAALGTPPARVVIVMASRIEPLKGHGLLIDALAQLRRTDWEAWIVGGAQRQEETRYLAGVRQSVDNAGLGDRVRFLGERSDVNHLLAAADIYCQPNTGPEAFGLSFVEALAAGLPVVTTRLGAAPEIVDADCGVLVEPGSAAALSATLTTLIEDGGLRRRLGESGRRRAVGLCDLPTAFTRLASTLSAVSHRSVPSS
jgi:glycosyltransferase involved in cell wall biosynthesis